MTKGKTVRHTPIAALLVAALPLLGEPPAPQPADTSGRPDLIVRVDFQKEQKLGKWYVRIRFTVSNIRLAPASPTILGSWCVAGPGACPRLHVGPDRFAPAVEAGATSVVKLDTPGIPVHNNAVVLGPETEEWLPGRYTIRAKADFTERLVETNEENNVNFAVIVIP
jgi:hypothetical protein